MYDNMTPTIGYAVTRTTSMDSTEMAVAPQRKRSTRRPTSTSSWVFQEFFSGLCACQQSEPAETIIRLDSSESEPCDYPYVDSPLYIDARNPPNTVSKERSGVPVGTPSPVRNLSAIGEEEECATSLMDMDIDDDIDDEVRDFDGIVTTNTGVFDTRYHENDKFLFERPSSPVPMGAPVDLPGEFYKSPAESFSTAATASIYSRSFDEDNDHHVLREDTSPYVSFISEGPFKDRVSVKNNPQQQPVQMVLTPAMPSTEDRRNIFRPRAIRASSDAMMPTSKPINASLSISSGLTHIDDDEDDEDDHSFEETSQSPFLQPSRMNSQLSLVDADIDESMHNENKENICNLLEMERAPVEEAQQ